MQRLLPGLIIPDKAKTSFITHVILKSLFLVSEIKNG
jgi:hypothetical protein